MTLSTTGGDVSDVIACLHLIQTLYTTLGGVSDVIGCLHTDSSFVLFFL
jgi:hypothetical protein